MKPGSFFTGAWELQKTYGVPVSLTVEFCAQQGFRFSVPHFVLDGIDDGAKPRTVLSQLWEALCDNMGPEDANRLQEEAKGLVPG
jgi:hypothetical protein